MVRFPDAVKRRPQRFGLQPGAIVDLLVYGMRRFLDADLASRRFSYRRSDGSIQELTLKDVVDRARLFEMAYNPSDCIEIRWAAAPDSPEMATCQRHAPAEQRQRMKLYREWFVKRQRPFE